MNMLCWRVPMRRDLDLVRPKRNTGSHFLACAAVPVGDKVYYFARNLEPNSVDQMAVSVFNTVTLRWMKVPPETTRGRRPVPSGRFGHTAVLIDSIVYIWGGAVNCKQNKSHVLSPLLDWVLLLRGEYLDNALYAFDVDNHRWFKPEISGFVPATRVGHSACVLGKIMFIYGGKSKTGFLNDIYKLDTATMVWSLINTIYNKGSPPPASLGHSATMIGTKMFVFGGLGSNWDHYNNIGVFDTETNYWLEAPSALPLPEARSRHSAFAYKGELYIFGGYVFSAPYFQYDDLWKFNSKTFSWKKVEPGQDWCSGMWCSIVRDRIILFGGYREPRRRRATQGLHPQPILQILDLSPTLKTLSKLAVIQYGLQLSCLPYNIRWELAAMTSETTSQIKVEEYKT